MIELRSEPKALKSGRRAIEPRSAAEWETMPLSSTPTRATVSSIPAHSSR